jgi:thiol-disulfide isomerase/thioredoxin
MKNSARVFYLILLLSLLCAQCGRGPEEAAIDRPAPRFQLSDLYGREVSLAQFQGKVVILDFWATWCGPCRMSMPLLEKLQQEFPTDLKLLAINLEEPADLVKDYVSRQNIHSTVLLDTEGQVGRAYGSESIPMQVLVDKKGIVRDVQMGFSPRMTERLRQKIVELRAD